MTFAGIVFGIFPGLIETAFAKPIAMTQVIEFEEFHLKLWHGFNTVLGLSAITITIGVILYFTLKPKHNLENAIARLDVIAPKDLTLKLSEGFAEFSRLWTNFFQTGYLRHYISVIVAFLILLLGYLIFSDFSLTLDFSTLADLTIYEISILLMLLMGVLYTVFTKSRLAAVAALGVVGLSFSLLFLFYSAPDLAMTQFSVDTLTVILFVLVLYKLPKYLNFSNKWLRIKHGVLSVSFGILITLLILRVLKEPKNAEITEFYAENAYKLAHGKNVVNVILVDFRGIDTMIEISVLIVAALGVFGLLKLRLKTRDKK